MIREMRWEGNGETIHFYNSRNAAVFMDFGSFNPALTNGSFDKRAAPGLDGTITYGANLNEMQPRLEARVLACNLGSKEYPVEQVLDEYRMKLCNAFNPLVEGVLYCSNTSGNYCLRCRAVSLPAFGPVEAYTLPFTVDLYADSPYWESENERVVNVGITDPNIETPLVLPAETGELHTVDSMIYNESKYVSYPVIRFWPANISPVLYNRSTGKTIELNIGPSSGFYVEVDTNPIKNTVLLWRQTENGEYEEVENVTHWLSLGSAIDFSLAPGENRIRVDRISASLHPSITVYWRERFLGV